MTVNLDGGHGGGGGRRWLGTPARRLAVPILSVRGAPFGRFPPFFHALQTIKLTVFLPTT